MTLAPNDTASARSGPRPSGAGSERLCPACGKTVDPLRAGQVAVIDGAFVYYCDAACKRASRAPSPASEAPTASPPEVFPRPSAPKEPEPSVRAPTGERIVAAESTPPSEPRSRTPDAVQGPVAFTVRVALWGAVGASALAIVSLAVRGDVGVLELALLSIATLAAVTFFVVRPGSPAEAHPLLPVLALVAMLGGVLVRARVSPSASSLVTATMSIAAFVAIEEAVRRASASIDAARRAIREALDAPLRAVHGDVVRSVAASQIRSGEIVVVRAGEVLGVDGVVIGGEGDVSLWFDSEQSQLRREGDALVAGARVLTGELRVQVHRTGRDRTWLTLADAPNRRVDVVAPLPYWARIAVDRGVLVLGVVVGAVFAVASGRIADGIGVGAAVLVALSSRAAIGAVAMLYGRAHLTALSRGVVYRDALAFERAATVDQVVYCARGTLLLGEPEVIAVESLTDGGDERIVGLAAAVGAVSRYPLAVAVARGTPIRSSRVEGVRNVVESPGLGVVCVTASGETAAVGCRGLLLQEKISVAAADARVSELEAQGRSVVLVALAGKLLGFVALQDGLRQGARASVQRLITARVEPVLLSGESRETCEAIAGALEIDHVRPEVLPSDRAREVRALREAGHSVAVIGHPNLDDGPLEAATVSIAMPSRGSKLGDFAVELVGDDVLDASCAITVPRRARERALLVLIAGIAPGVVAAIGIGFGIAPPFVAPIAALVGTCVLFLRERDAPRA